MRVAPAVPAVARLSSRRARAILPVLCLFALCIPLAGAGFLPVEQAYELRLLQVRLPDAPGGRLQVTPCTGCRGRLLDTRADTEWRLGHRGEALDLASFRDVWSRALASSRRSIAFVYYEPASRTVNRVVLLWEAPEVGP